jgi:hypothetical protein
MKAKLLLLLMLLTSLATYAYDFESNGIYYNITSADDKTVEVTSGDTEYTGDVVIPETVTYSDVEYTVTSIGGRAFYYHQSLTGVEMPASVTKIGEEAFLWCSSLSNVVLPSSLTTIGWCAFHACRSLSNIELPPSLISIESQAFSYCASLTNIEVPSSVTKIGYSAFGGCYLLTNIKLPASLTSIGDYAFYCCESLTSIELQASLTTIGDYAFYVCESLKTVTSLNPEPPTLNSTVFYGGHIETVYVPTEAVEAYQVADCWKDYNIVDIAYKDLVTDFEVDGIYYHVTSDTDKSVEVTSGVTAYTGNVVIPDTVTYSDTEYSVISIGDYAFYDCTSLTRVELPTSLTSIGDGAFYECSDCA